MGMIGLAIGGGAFVALLTALAISLDRREKAADLPDNVRMLLAVARRRALLAVGAAAALTFLGVLVGLHTPSLMGLPFAMSTGVAGAAGLLLYAATPPAVTPVPTSQVREASLAHRSPWSHISPWTVILPAALAVLQVLFTAFAFFTASTDEVGRARMIRFEGELSVSGASPYAGWYYSGPALVTSVLLTGAFIVALRRIAATPAIPNPSMGRADEAWRRASTRALGALVSAALALPLGGMTFVSGASMQNAANFYKTLESWTLLGGFLQIAGALLVIGSAASLGRACRLALGLPDEVARVVRDATAATVR